MSRVLHAARPVQYTNAPHPILPPSPGVSCDAALRGHCDALVIPADVAGATHQRPLKSTPFGGTHVFMLTCLQTQRIDGPVYALQSNMQHAMCAGTRFNRRAIRAASAMPSRGAGTRRISSTGISVGSANLFRAAPHEQTETRASDNSAPPAPLWQNTECARGHMRTTFIKVRSRRHPRSFTLTRAR